MVSKPPGREMLSHFWPLMPTPNGAHLPSAKVILGVSDPLVPPGSWRYTIKDTVVLEDWR